MGDKLEIKTSTMVIPMIYAYTLPGVTYREGWTKIGQTGRDVDQRVSEQTHTAGLKAKIEWRCRAIYKDGSGDIFTDHDFHAYLEKNGVKHEKTNEWFLIAPSVAETMLDDFRENRGIVGTDSAMPYTLREEQKTAVSKAKSYFDSHNEGEFLWNAKPRFGKTLSVYDLCKQTGASNVLIVTNRPSIANSWYEDWEKFLGDESGYRFVSETSSLKDRASVMSREDFDRLRKKNPEIKCIEFLSLQDLKGSVHFGGKYDKLKHVTECNWDILVIDEAHEGVDTYKTDVAFDHIKRKNTLHLSGTPFKALASDKFEKSAIYNWTYADEQKAKQDWNPSSEEENPYANLPRLSLYTYQMSEIISDEVRKGIDINGNTEEYAFDLNEFFITNGRGTFKHKNEVEKFLKALRTQERYPFSTPELRNELKHTFWLLKYVDSAKALAKMLRKDPVFKDYKIVLAAGDGKLDEEEENAKAYDKVREAIENNDKTITLSVGQLTTGITIPEWTGVLMLSNIGSPALYMQAAFRAQNPCLFRQENGEYLRKENAYVFDFDPARTLDIFEKFANDLSSETTSGRGDVDRRKRQVRELLNFFPVVGEDADGRMVELDAEQVLSIPRKIHSTEVVRRGFMSDFLFQNISNVFHAPPRVWDLISSMEALKEPKPVSASETDGIEVDANGDIALDQSTVIGTATELFGEKIFGVARPEEIEEVLVIAENTVRKSDAESDLIEKYVEKFNAEVSTPMIDVAEGHYKTDLSEKAKKDLTSKIKSDVRREVTRSAGDYRIAQRTLDMEADKARAEAKTESERGLIDAQYQKKKEDAQAAFVNDVFEKVNAIAETIGERIVTRVMTDQQEKQRRDVENKIRDHLRGFSRTIPSFLMAYGDENEITLANFDEIIPDDVFVEVTGISTDDFRFLRDGGDYVDDDGETKHFDGHLFDEIVFDDSVKEFMAKKRLLADYFDESAKEDIFDYIPPQKTNQIFTPKETVIMMVDLLEQENPGCFDDDSSTFLDPYMKSGLYIAEIVKRLYRSDRMKELHPDPEERLDHIFSKQVYGLAPTEIIYRIVLSFVLGFSDGIEIEKHNLRKFDSLEPARNGNLEDELKSLYNMR